MWMDSLDPPGMVWLSVNHCRLCPFNHMVLLNSVISKSGLVVFWKAGCALTSGRSLFVHEFTSILLFLFSNTQLSPSFTYVGFITVCTGTLYTHCVKSSFFILSLRCTSILFNVLLGFIATRTLYFFIILAMASETFSAYRITVTGRLNKVDESVVTVVIYCSCYYCYSCSCFVLMTVTWLMDQTFPVDLYLLLSC